MHISVATANFYFLPFEETLEIIAEAGFQNIELDLFWEWKQWSMAQHIKDVPVSDVVRSIQRSALKVISIHDTGGVLNHYNSTTNYIDPRLNEYLDHLGYAPEYLVFHPPHAEGDLGADWWNKISIEMLQALAPYRAVCKFLALENMPFFEGFTVPLTTPEELHTFATQNELGVNIDTTHYAQIGVDILSAAQKLNGSIRSVHLSDYKAGRSHVFVGEGELDLAGFLRVVDPQVLHTVTLECSISSVDKSDKQMSHGEMVNRMKLLKATVENLPIDNI